MPKQSLSYQAEALWLRLLDARAEAEAAHDWGRAHRIEQISERAWWRLLRRMNLACRQRQRRNPRPAPALRYGRRA